MVFFFHFPLVSSGSWGGIFSALNAGVGIFYVLSGFLIAMRYEGKVKVELDWIGAYLRNRVARIFPVYFLVLAVALLVHRETNLAKIAANVTLFSGFLPESWASVAVSWSLTVEFCFYLIAPFIFVGAKRAHLLLVICIALAGIGLLLCSWGASPRFVFERTILGRIGEFLIGVFFARLWLNERYRTILVSLSGKTLAGASGVVAYLILVSRVESLSAELALKAFLLPLSAVVLITGLISEKNPASRILSTSLFSVLGKSSYSFYLIHLGVFSGIVMAKLRLGIAGNFILASLASIAIFYLYEKPAESWIKSIANRRII